MFADWDDYLNDDEALGLLKRYHEMRTASKVLFFDQFEFEGIIEYYLNEYNYKEAMEAAVLALQQHPDSSVIKIKFIQILIETGKPSRALRMIRQIEKAEVSNYQIWLFRGIALHITGKYKEAVSNFDHAIQLCTESKDEVAYVISQSFIQTHQYYPANRYLLLSYRFNRKNMLTLYDLALNYERLDMPERSMKFYHEFLDEDPFAEHVWNNLGLLYARIGDIPEAMKSFDFAVAVNPDYISAKLNKADILMTQENFAGAIEIYHDILMENPDNIRTLCCLGDCYEEAGKHEMALRSFERAISLCPDHGDAWFGKGLALMRLNKYSQSLSAIKKALMIDPEDADYWFTLGELYAAMHKYSQAIPAYKKAVEINPDDHEAWLACAQVFFKKRKICEAIKTLSQSYVHINANPTLHYRLAAYHVYQDDADNAGMHFEQALKLNYQEHQDMFSLFPKTREFGLFYALIEKHQAVAKHKIRN